ncbi:p115 like vesicle tethering protein [Russula dissimulans]|nr:p115 like vesicle tethering protein [Russula dissimulans]
MEFFQQTYTALRGPTGVQQTPADTITRLSDRLSPSTLLADRRAAVLSLKGLARAHKQLVGIHSLQGLLEIIQNDADVDPDIGRAAIEIVSILCDTLEASYTQRDLGLEHTDRLLEDEKTVHKLFALLGDQDHSLRYSTCVLLIGILQNRPQKVQAYFLKASVGPATVIALLEGEKDIAGQAIAMLAALIRQSTEIQKILAFDGIFEKLFAVVTREGGLEGQSVVTDALKCVDTLLRFNTSNQSYFRETDLPSLLCSLLFFTPHVQPDQAVPQEFALQFWNEDKTTNAGLILEAIGLLLGSKGAGLREGYAFTRLLIEMALASNAPTTVKVKCLRLLPPAAAPLLPDIILTPYIPVPDTNGEEWDRLEAATGIDALLELIMHGEYNGQDSERRKKESVDLRATAVGVFEHFLRDDHVKEAVVSGMLPPEDAGLPAHSPVTPLLFGLIIPPSSPLDRTSVASVQFSTILFAHLLRHAPHCKDLARRIVPPPLTPLPASSTAGGAFFVPADGEPPPPTESASRDDAEDGPQSLLALLAEHLSLAFLQRSRAGLTPRDAREADRVICAYLSLLSQWLWEDPRAVREFLEAGGLGVLVEQVNQPSEIDVVVPGLCAFLLGVCYEFNREPGEVTRVTMHSILTRLGADVLVGRMNRMREDERIKVVGPDSWVLPCPTPGPQALDPAFTAKYEGETEIWFDWAFVDFWKANNHTIQRGIVADPDSASSSTAQSGEESILVASLRGIIAKQAAEIEELQIKLKVLTAASLANAGASYAPEPSQSTAKSDEDRAASETALEAERAKRAEVEKEQEDLLVLLDELSGKRKKDKERMKEQGMEVSEDEDDEDEDEEGEEEE